MSYFTQTGQWNGYYIQNEVETKMQFNNLYINPVPQGYVKGQGEDDVGKFIFKGSFNNNATEVRFIKQYIGAHYIFYEGQFDGDEIEGNWGFEQGQWQDKFKIWMHNSSMSDGSICYQTQ